ncbi:uncharacterized protein LOC131669884 [Phymastichus coffea]|uniref:uncharacterized protein LOC131669884 n=1 Tax=Phymastichus coffea TaxID=108790 RepID=UPI00273A83BF|nr:uncharacterized protein LOC131669884 [Phymastichus coffea]
MAFRTNSINVNSKKRYTGSLTYSRSGIVYNALLICILITLKYFTIKFLCETEYGGKIKFEKTINVMHDSFTVFSAIYILLVFSIQQKRTITLVNDFKIIGQSILALNDKNFSLLSAVKNIFLANTFTWFLLIITSVVGDWDLNLYNISIYLCNTIINSIFMQYSIILNLIKEMLYYINQYLSKLLNNANPVSGISFIHSKKMQYEINKLTYLRNLHTSIFKFSQDVSNFYSQLILLGILYVFVTSVLFGYYILIPIVHGRYPVSRADSIHCIFFLLLYAVSLKILMNTATMTVKESKKLRDILNDSLDNIEDESVIKKVNNFSIYLLQKDMNFAVYNLFSLDESILLSIIGSVMTYLVIILQFQTEESKSV